MKLSQESESFNNSECPFCNKFVPYKSRSFCGKIMTSIKKVGRATDVVLKQLKYREKNFEIYTSSKTWADSGRKCVKRYEDREILDEEHAIIIANYKEKSEKKEEGIFSTSVLIFGSGIDLICNYLESNKIKFKIFNCYDPNFFSDSINKTTAHHLWIFADGARHKVFFGEDVALAYCKVKDAPKRSFIAQLHCCHGEGTTLWEYLSEKPGIFSEGYRHPIKNREDIKAWIQKETALKIESGSS